MNQFESLFDDEEWVNQNMNRDPIEIDIEDITDSEAQVGSNGKKRNSYTIDFKLEAIAYAKNQPFKAAIQSYYNDWMLEGTKEHTPAGNPRAASMEVYLEWVCKAWSAISPELIRKSFKVCGIITATDGSEDDLIHCMKPEGSVPSARDLLRKARNSEVHLVVQEELDEEEDYNNGYESDAEIE